MTTPWISIAFFILASLLGAFGQFFYKSGADHASNTLAGYALNGRIWSGMICYIAVMVLFVAAFKKGGELSVLYPIYATTFIWAAFIAWAAYDDPIKPVNVLGMALLIAGMYFMGK